MLKKFPNNSRVAFIGDSITAENLELSHIITAYKKVYPDFNVRFFNCGVAGGTADFAVKSYERDIKRYKPTHAVVCFGINDSRRDLLSEQRSADRYEKLLEAFELYKRRLTELVERLLADGVEIMLSTPTPYDEYSESPEPPLRGGYSLMLGYSRFVCDLAREKGIALYDKHERLSRIMAYDRIHSQDRIHPQAHGYFILAREFLREQGIDYDCEGGLPDSFSRWHGYVARLRKVLASECMLIEQNGLSFDSPTEDKLAVMNDRVDREDFGRAVFESFYRSYVKDKPLEEELYRLIDLSYEEDILAK